MKSEEEDDDDDDDDGNYLHPSLFASKKCSRLEELMKVIDPIKITFYLVIHPIWSHKNSNMQVLRSLVTSFFSFPPHSLTMSL